jgi:hypothetical protein
MNEINSERSCFFYDSYNCRNKPEHVVNSEFYTCKDHLSELIGYLDEDNRYEDDNSIDDLVREYLSILTIKELTLICKRQKMKGYSIIRKKYLLKRFVKENLSEKLKDRIFQNFRIYFNKEKSLIQLF